MSDLSTGSEVAAGDGPNTDTFLGMVNSLDGPPARPSRALIATADDVLLDDLLRLAAAAGVTPHVESDLTGVRRSWQTATLVLVGPDLATPLARSQPVRRTGVVVVGTDLDDAGIYQSAVAIGADQVVVLPGEESVLSDRLADSAEDAGATGFAVTLTVVGGRGGAGASTLAAALAVCAAQRRLRTTLIDGDPLGGGLDLLFGGERHPGVRWQDLAGTSGRVSAGALRAALPVFDDLAVLSWGRDDVVLVPPDAMRSVLGAAQRSNDLVVVDLPRYGDDAADEALGRATSTLLVVPRDVRSCAAATRVAGRLAMVGGDLRLVAREAPSGSLKPADLTRSIGAPVAAELRLDKDLPRQIEEGHFAPQPRSALGKTCATLLDGFGLFGRDVA